MNPFLGEEYEPNLGATPDHAEGSMGRDVCPIAGPGAPELGPITGHQTVAGAALRARHRVQTDRVGRSANAPFFVRNFADKSLIISSDPSVTSACGIS